MNTPRQLILVRHAEAAWATANEPDFDRRLTAEGHRDTEVLAAWLRHHAPAPDAIVTSPAPRALATAEGLAAAWPTAPAIAIRPELYEAPLETPISLIHNLPPQWHHVVIVGHNPSLSHTADWLLGEPTILEFAPGSMAWLTFERLAWHDLAPGCAQLQHHQLPEPVAATKS